MDRDPEPPLVVEYPGGEEVPARAATDFEYPAVFDGRRVQPEQPADDAHERYNYDNTR